MRTDRVSLIAALLVAAGCYGYTQSTESPGPVPTPPDTDDPPGQVGRLALIDGAVSFRPAAGDTWAIPEPNRPVTTGDALWVDSVGHVEVEIGPNSLRASRETEMDIVHLDDDMLQVRVPQGSIDIRVKKIDIKKDYEIDAPNAAIILDQDGEYRIDVTPSGDTTRVTAWSGQAQVTAAGSSFAVEAGQTASVLGETNPTYDLASAGAQDDFDRWSRDRDAREDRVSASAQYTQADMGGIEDLDAYGGWVPNPDYGPVWFPTTVEVGWSPYAFGNWIWVDPWGWTWEDNYSWGWAPFHYGRWAYIGGAWGWCPGAFALGYDPYWAPGFVGWLGGPDWGLGVGWFPLGPRERFNPWYHVGVRYADRINYGTVANIGYRNRGIPGAVTAVPSRAFGAGPIGREAVHPSAAELGHAGVLGGGPGVAPTRASLGGLRDRGPAAFPPARLASRSVVALHAPPPAPVRFSAEEHQIAANGGRPLSYSERANLRATDASARNFEPPVHSALGAGHSLTPARAGLPRTSPAGQGGFRRPAGTALDQSYRQERQQLETQHMQEFANPRATESREQMYQRQEAEHRELNFRYNTARIGGMSQMPARVGGGGHHR